MKNIESMSMSQMRSYDTFLIMELNELELREAVASEMPESEGRK